MWSPLCSDRGVSKLYGTNISPWKRQFRKTWHAIGFYLPYNWRVKYVAHWMLRLNTWLAKVCLLAENVTCFATQTTKTIIIGNTALNHSNTQLLSDPTPCLRQSLLPCRVASRVFGINCWLIKTIIAIIWFRISRIFSRHLNWDRLVRIRESSLAFPASSSLWWWYLNKRNWRCGRSQPYSLLTHEAWRLATTQGEEVGTVRDHRFQGVRVKTLTSLPCSVEAKCLIIRLLITSSALCEPGD